MNQINAIGAAGRDQSKRSLNLNERAILSLLQRNGAMPGSDLAQQTGLSAQTISVSLRKLKADGLTRQGKPLRGKVGKPSIPITLNPWAHFLSAASWGGAAAISLLWICAAPLCSSEA